MGSLRNLLAHHVEAGTIPGAVAVLGSADGDAEVAPDSFFPGFWETMGWGYGVGVQLAGPHAGRYGWSGGQGTDFFVDPDGRIGILLTQVELSERVWGPLGEFQEVS